MKIGLFFGSFNPIHVGHLIIANHFVEHTDLDKVWFVVTPHNPHKNKSSLLNNYDRLDLVYKACEDYENIEVSDFEFKLPQPNYTVNSLIHLTEKHPNYEFSLIMGEDNLNTFHKWKNYQTILNNHAIYCYPRVNKIKEENSFKSHPKVSFIDAPIIELSSSFIRKSITENKNVLPMLHPKVWKLIDEMNFYR